MEIRPANVDDAPAISALIHRNLALLTVDSGGAGAEQFLLHVTPQAILGYLESPGFRYRVALEESVLAGVVAIRNGTHVYHLFVQPERHGLGLGRRLWTLARRELVDPGARMLTVNSSINAVPVYEAFGFQIGRAHV